MMKELPLFLLLLCLSICTTAQSNEFHLLTETGFGAPTVLGDKMIFVSSNDALGSEIWISDGTEAGTTVLRDIEPGEEDSNPNRLTLVGDKVYFVATTTEFGREIWVTDGTTEGTKMVKDIIPGEAGLDYSFLQLHEHNDQLYAFITLDEVLANPLMEMWTSDGTEAGTVKVKTLCDCGTPGYIADHNGDMYFKMGFFYYRSDGTEAGTVDIGNESFPTFAEEIAAAGGQLYISGELGDAVYVSDGETASLLINGLNTAGTEPEHFYEYDGQVYFSAANKIYVSDGTPEGTMEFADIQMDWNYTGGDNAQRFFTWNDHLYFVGKDKANETHHIYKTDGDPNNIVKIADTTDYGAFYETQFLPADDYFFVLANSKVMIMNDEFENQENILIADEEYTQYVTNYTASNLLYFNDLLYFRASVSFYNGIWTFDPSGISVANESIDQKELSAYPNPVQSQIFVSNLEEGASYSITTLDAQTMIEGSVHGKRIPVANLPAGLYLLQVQTDARTRIVKFVKE